MGLRARFYIETILAAGLMGLLSLTLIRPNWAEALVGVDIDAGLGSFEWLLVGALALVAYSYVVLARREWRRARSFRAGR